MTPELDTRTRTASQPGQDDRAAERHVSPATASTPRTWLTTVALVVIALVAIAVATIAVLEIVSDPPPEAATTQEVVSPNEDTALARLVNHGYIPREALESPRDLTEALVNSGLVPDQAWQPPVYTREDVVLVRMVRAGILPPDAIEGEVWTTRQLVVQGLVPRLALVPSPPSASVDDNDAALAEAANRLRQADTAAATIVHDGATLAEAANRLRQADAATTAVSDNERPGGDRATADLGTRGLVP